MITNNLQWKEGFSRFIPQTKGLYELSFFKQMGEHNIYLMSHKLHYKEALTVYL